ncbi:MAG TPA: 2-oxoglutarate dehydrogenase complex dihydrolipoyllysine-residue succinyltransferase [Methylomirabilota bacterium]|nr:2-oxoglutarate dehydrogenase complex dihydrolipoyllysine-residue succinyltransferase [Methylomirabilota bacterium]
MTIELKIPSVGESISEVQIAEWLKSDGDMVKKDENVAVLDSEKTTLELPAPEGGRLKILHQAGDTVKIGEVVARIETNGETEKADGGRQKAEMEKPKVDSKQEPVSDSEIKTEKAAPAAETKKENLPEKSPKPAQKNGEANEPTVVEAEKSADEKVEVQETKKEVLPQPQIRLKAQARPGEKIVPMTMLRRTVAKHLVEAKQQMAMLTTFNEVDMSAVRTSRKENQEAFEKRYQVKLGFMSFFVKAVVGALKQFSQLNAEIRGNDIVYHDRFDIGVAIASDRGLVVPVLRNAEHMSFAEIEKAIADFAKRSKEGKLKPEELQGGTFTITNGGVFGSLLSTPIINPPQTGILGMHTIQERPIALNGQVVIRPMMFLALTYDHRLVDGREAVMFLRDVKEMIEDPARMLIEI